MLGKEEQHEFLEIIRRSLIGGYGHVVDGLEEHFREHNKLVDDHKQLERLSWDLVGEGVKQLGELENHLVEVCEAANL